MKRIILSQGKYALVDDNDFDWLNQWKWYFDGNYAKRAIGRNKKIYMHHLILPISKGQQVDHVSLDKLDNRRNNLRISTNSLQQANTRRRSDNKSGFKGVSWNKYMKKYDVRIMMNQKQNFIGLFDDLIEAAKAYDKKAKELYGEFARLNFP